MPKHSPTRARARIYTYKRSPKPADSNPINLKILNIIESYTQDGGAGNR